MRSLFSGTIQMYGYIDFLLYLSSLGLTFYGYFHSKAMLFLGLSLFIFYPIFPELFLHYSAKLKKIQPPKIDPNVLPIVYHPLYNITACGLQNLHPFDSTKYRRVFQKLQQILVNGHLTPQICPRGLLQKIHPFSYLLSLCYSLQISRIIQVPVFLVPSSILRLRVLEPMLRAVHGSVIGACAAISKGWSINLSGGYHHCSYNSGGGFCAFADITLAILCVKQWFPEKVKKSLVVDLDAHQGNGHQRDFMDDQSVQIVDFYNAGIYPFDQEAKKGIGYQQCVTGLTSDQEYLRLLEETLMKAFEEFQPDFVVYNAGTDCMDSDPLGRLRISQEGIVKRDQVVFRFSLERKVPILMVLSGGYQWNNAPVIGDSILNLVRTFNLDF